MVVFTQGLLASPFSTALRASSAAPSITSGLEVLVHEVIAAIATAPWSSTNSPRSSDFTDTGLVGRPEQPSAAEGTACAGSSSSAKESTTESLAGKDSATASS